MGHELDLHTNFFPLRVTVTQSNVKQIKNVVIFMMIHHPIDSIRKSQFSTYTNFVDWTIVLLDTRTYINKNTIF